MRLRRGRRDGRRLRLFVCAFGDAGHAFPAIALARALAERGHDVTVESWGRWREAVEDLGLAFHAAEEYTVFPPPPPDGSGGPTAADAARALMPAMKEMRPDLVVTDILTIAPALAAEAAEIPFATLVPHVYPPQDPGTPFFAFGFLPARTPVGRWAWRRWQPLLEAGLRQGRDEYNETRARVGLPPLDRLHSGLSDELTLVATFPQLEYPRAWPDHVHVTGPMFFEVPHPEIEIPEGDEPLILVAPSTAQDTESNLVLAALEALDGEPVRVVATTNLMRKARQIEAPANAAVVDWVSYSQVMPQADLVISHGGHGTSARALAEGLPLLSVPAFGDTAENGARVTWAGAGLMVPRPLAGPRTLRAAVRRILSEPRFAQRAREIAAWSERNDGAKRGAEVVERHALARAESGQRAR